MVMQTCPLAGGQTEAPTATAAVGFTKKLNAQATMGENGRQTF
jgi:hypothetical protein